MKNGPKRGKKIEHYYTIMTCVNINKIKFKFIKFIINAISHTAHEHIYNDIQDSNSRLYKHIYIHCHPSLGEVLLLGLLRSEIREEVSSEIL